MVSAYAYQPCHGVTPSRDDTPLSWDDTPLSRRDTLPLSWRERPPLSWDERQVLIITSSITTNNKNNKQPNILFFSSLRSENNKIQILVLRGRVPNQQQIDPVTFADSGCFYPFKNNPDADPWLTLRERPLEARARAFPPLFGAM